METALFLPFLGILLLLIAGAVLLLALGYHRLISHLEQRDQAQPNPTKKSLAEADQLVASALHQSKKLIQVSEEKAEDIVEDAQFFTASTQKELSAQLEQASQQHLQNYRQTLELFHTELKKHLQQLEKSTVDNIRAEVEHFHQQLTSSTQMSQKELAGQVKAHLEATQKELQDHHKHLEEYRAETEKALAKQAEAVIHDVAKKVLPQAISLTDHEHLIIQALTTAKNTHAI